MKRRMLIVGGSIGVGVLLILSMIPTVVSAQTINLDERQTNIFQHVKEKIKNNDWKPGETLNIKLLKNNIKDVTWFPGGLIYIFYVLIILIYTLLF